jgi:hypothetical protein
MRIELMKQKWPIFAGILLLTLGIIFRFMQFDSGLYVPFFAVGGVLKLLYLVKIIAQGKYRPGLEMGLLILGLILFFLSLVLKNNYNSDYYIYFLVPGITLKILFIVLFIYKLQNRK